MSNNNVVWLSIVLFLNCVSAGHSDSDAPFDLNAWPLLQLEKQEGNLDVRFLSPLGQFTNKDGNEIRALRPAFSWQLSASGEKSLDIVWPLIDFETSAEGDFGGRVFPIFWADEVSGDQEFIVFPVFWLWWNKHRTKGIAHGTVVGPAYRESRYGLDDFHRGIFPLYMASKEGDSESLWLVPYYGERNEKDPNEYVRGILPFYLHSQDSDGQRSTWAMPVYMKKGHEGLERLVVFPLFWKGEGYFVLFPFYGRGQKDDEQWRIAMWPTYSSRSEGDYRHQALLTVLGAGTDNAGTKKWHFWPLFGHSETKLKRGDLKQSYPYRGFPQARRLCRQKNLLEGEAEQSWALWPVFWVTKSRMTVDNKTNAPPVSISKRAFHAFPLFWTGSERKCEISDGSSEIDKTSQERVTEAYNWLLPLYTCNRNEDRTVFTMLWPLWWQRMSDKQEQTSVLWRLVDASYYPNGDRKINVLWRGYTDEITGDSRRVHVFPFMTYRRSGESKKRFQLLGGLFEWGREDRRKYFRLLYLPRIP